MKARTQAINAVKALVVTAPDELREQLRELSAVRLVQTAAKLEPGPVTTPTAAARLGLRTLARRYQALSAELTILDAELDRLTATAAPRLVALLGSGRTRPGHCWSPPATTQIGCAPTPASQCCAAPRRSRPPRARPSGIG
jgi:transposase